MNISCDISNLHREDNLSAHVTPRKQRFYTRHIAVCVYQFCCSCGFKYISRTVRNLPTRIGEHMVEVGRYSQKCCDQARIPEKPQSTLIYPARNLQTLAFAETVAIHKGSPDLCVQKQMVMKLGLNWWGLFSIFPLFPSFALLLLYLTYLSGWDFHQSSIIPIYVPTLVRFLNWWFFRLVHTWTILNCIFSHRCYFGNCTISISMTMLTLKLLLFC